MTSSLLGVVSQRLAQSQPSVNSYCTSRPSGMDPNICEKAAWSKHSGYEILGYHAGDGPMKAPLFGMAPCPTAIFTIGMLLLAHCRLVVWLAVIPIVWSLVRDLVTVRREAHGDRRR